MGRIWDVRNESGDVKNSSVCRVAVSSKGDSLDSEIGSIGSSKYFIIFEGRPDKFNVCNNEAMGQGSEASVTAAGLLKSMAVSTIITTSIGERGVLSFQKAGITVHAGCSGTVKEGIQKCLKGELSECKGATYAGPMKW
jgi:predicted Fe-Mo cluster-binding NifX family protein